MGTSTDRGKALRLLHALENGGKATAEARDLAEALDPVLLHVIVRYLREVYPVSEPAAGAVLERVLDLTRHHPGIVAKAKQGEEDPVSQWFVGQYTFAEFRGRGDQLVELIVEKLES
jgi:hypothetical protein